MNTTKTLMLAAAAALTLGAGSAFAQYGPGGYSTDYQAARTAQSQLAQPGQVQSGSSDVNSAAGSSQLGFIHATPDRGNATVGGDGSGG
jgi:hypothetical protein